VPKVAPFIKAAFTRHTGAHLLPRTNNTEKQDVLKENKKLRRKNARILDENTSLKNGYSLLENAYKNLGDAYANLKDEHASLEEAYAKLECDFIELRERNEDLEAENRKLFEAANLGSDTSGIPSSKDWKKNGASNEPENTPDPDGCQGGNERTSSVSGYLRKNNGEKRGVGGQKNHPPAFMNIDDAQEEPPVRHFPKRCANCGKLNQCLENGTLRQTGIAHEYDIKIIRTHRVHQMFKATACNQDGAPVGDDFPEVIGSQYYGINVQLMVITWHHIFHGSYDRIDLAAKELLGLTLSAATANSIVKRTSAKILGSRFMDAVRFFILLFDKLAGADETSATVAGRKAWVHTIATANVTLLTAHWRRGYEGTIYVGVLQFYIYTLITDCWAAYFKEDFKCKHAICDGHILRELVAAAYFRHQGWAIEMFDLLLEIYTAKCEAVENKEKGLAQEYIDDIMERYDQIVNNGYKEIGGEKKGKTFALLERLSKLKDSALAFATDFNVSFTNNASEISLRNLKVALRVAGQFRTLSGLADYCIIQSFMDTCRKQGHNPFDMLCILLAGGDIIEAVFGEEKAEQIKQMIMLAEAFNAKDKDKIDAMVDGLHPMLTEELIGAASYGLFEPFNGQPTEPKTAPPAAPKEKMQAARDMVASKKISNATAADLRKGNADNSHNKSNGRMRDGP